MFKPQNEQIIDEKPHTEHQFLFTEINENSFELFSFSVSIHFNKISNVVNEKQTILTL